MHPARLSCGKRRSTAFVHNSFLPAPPVVDEGVSMVSGPKEFVHLHCHSDYSLLDGCARIDRYMARLQELGMPAMAMTDHGNLFGALEFYKQARAAGIKPIIGCEIYLVHDHRMEERPKRERNRSDDIADLPEDQAPGPEAFPKYQIHHKTLLARNFTGYQNLVQLVSDAHLRGMYYRPRTDMEQLARHAEGIIGLSGCVNGVAAQHLIYGDYAKAREATAQFVDIFGRNNYYIEIQDHGIPVQRRIIPGLLKLAKEFDLKVVCANDVHYVFKEDAAPHDALLCIQTGKLLSDTSRMRYPCQEFYLKSRTEMEALFREVPESVTNTLEVAEKVDLEIPFGESHYPVFEAPVELGTDDDRTNFERILDIYVREKNKVNTQDGTEQPFELIAEEREALYRNGRILFSLCKKGLLERYGVDYDDPERYEPGEGEPADYAEILCGKLDYELAIITGTGFVDYFLIVWDFIDWARQRGIPVGPGRGSGAGCIVAYVLKITDIEPLRFGLLFERMLNLERVSPPDFDIDFCMRRRDEVVEYVREKYGAESVANIITFGSFGAKMVVRDLARVQDVPYAEADRLAKMIPDELNITLEKSVEKSAELAAEVKVNPVAATILEQGKVIEGMVRNTGKHACGIIIGDRPITELVPVTLQEGDLTTQYPKGPVEDLGLLKMDFLGLKTLTVIADAQENIRLTTQQNDFDIERIPLSDSRTFDLLNSGRTTGVFQLESGGMQSLCRQIGLSSFEEIIALIALYRPGPMQFIPQFVEGKRNPESVQIPHPLLKDLVSETYGVLVYQEQVMEAARIIAGYSLGEADILRRAMGKKIKSVMDAQKEIFIKGARETHAIDKQTALDIFAILEKFAEYGFNKSHSAAYAMLSYRTAYLKANYPVQFMAAVLSCELGNADKVSHFIEECSAIGITVEGPHINRSRENFTPVLDAGEKGSILFGLGAIKGVGDGAARKIIEEREARGPFKDFRDFAARIDSKTANRRVMESLIKTGAFDYSGEDRGVLIEDLDVILDEVAVLQRDRERGQESFFDLLDPGLGSGSATGTNREAPAAPASGRKGISLHDKLQFEKELLGFYVSGHPMNAFEGLSEGIDTFEGTGFRDLPDRTPYRLCGVVTGVARKITRRDNRRWAVVSLGTRKANYTLNMYAEAWEKDGAAVEPGAILVVSGSVNHRNGEVVLSIDSARPIERAIPELVREIHWIVRPDSESIDFFQRLRAVLESCYGDTETRILLAVDPPHCLETPVAPGLKWQISTDAFRDLRRHPAVLDVRLVVPPPQLVEPAWKRRQQQRAS